MVDYCSNEQEAWRGQRQKSYPAKRGDMLELSTEPMIELFGVNVLHFGGDEVMFG